MDSKINATLEIADSHLNNAQNGLCKPEEDVVPYSVCKNSHSAIINYLSAYLMRNGREIPKSHTVEELLSFCREVNPVFEELHLAPFYHPTDTEDVWMNMDTANDFFKMAEKTKELVTKITN
ncbi:HEPN domain-containing protein [Ekhidna sp.]|uniref:HEPN domain-containing protein n=1 Tax=Ekhidna sp. TaxID=2608089 RepID=UPI003B500845